MAKPKYIATAMLANIATLLEAMTPEEFTPIDEAAPQRGRRIGTLTDNQKALVTLLNRSLSVHHALHRQSRMPFGGNSHLPNEHRLLHVMNAVLKEMLAEDLADTFSEVAQGKRFIIDRNWDVYLVKGWW